MKALIALRYRHVAPRIPRLTGIYELDTPITPSTKESSGNDRQGTETGERTARGGGARADISEHLPTFKLQAVQPLLKSRNAANLRLWCFPRACSRSVSNESTPTFFWQSSELYHAYIDVVGR